MIKRSLLVCSLFASDISLKGGWELLGATEDIISDIKSIDDELKNLEKSLGV